MNLLDECFAANRKWAGDAVAGDPNFFKRLESLQNPDLLWIGCSDSRLPPNEIIGRKPGELFVHRNVANLVLQTDLNCLSVIQYAVEALRVQHIIVCGHYGCGGVLAALRGEQLGLIDNWLRHVQDVRDKNFSALEFLADDAERHHRLCELNVVEQVLNVCKTTVVQGAWSRGQSLAVHGWIYSIGDGLLRDLDVCIASPDEMRQRILRP